jgi:two-component system chemotaxis response regulator CheY
MQIKRFLIAEDEALSRKILEDFFSEFASCDSAEDGLQAFEMFTKAILDGNPYDLVCTDLIMPKIDGYDLIRKIRACEQSLPIQDCVRTKIFVISVSDSSIDMSHALLDCDCDDYIVKPFHRNQLRNILEKYELVDNDYNIP